MTREPRALQPRRHGAAWIAAVVSTVNILQFVFVGWLGIPANFVAYMVANGRVPERADSATGSTLSLWLGHMPAPVPWQYFLVTALVMLAVSVYAAVPARRFSTTERRFAFWRTTPVFLAVAAAIIGVTQVIITNFYDTAQSPANPYHYGTYVACAAAAVSVAAWRLAPDAPTVSSRNATSTTRAGTR